MATHEKRMREGAFSTKNLIKRWARVHKEQWRQLSRYAILRPYCDKKYPSLTHLIIHLGIRENPYTWPTCTCPLKPDNTNIREIWDSIHGIAKQEKQNLIQVAQNNARQTIHEKPKRHLGEDALLNEKEPTKRIKLVPKAGRIETRNMTQWPPRKRRKGTQKNHQTTALIQLFPELQQQENHDVEATQSTNTRNHNARTDMGKEHQPAQDNQALESPQQHWPIQETAADAKSKYRKIKYQRKMVKSIANHTQQPRGEIPKK